eukprot:12061622-Alexandrium_andersonii.AAC.1
MGGEAGEVLLGAIDLGAADAEGISRFMVPAEAGEGPVKLTFLPVPCKSCLLKARLSAIVDE